MWLYEQNYTHAYTITNSYLVHDYVAIITHSVALNRDECAPLAILYEVDFGKHYLI